MAKETTAAAMAYTETSNPACPASASKADIRSGRSGEIIWLSATATNSRPNSTAISRLFPVRIVSVIGIPGYGASVDCAAVHPRRIVMPGEYPVPETGARLLVEGRVPRVVQLEGIGAQVVVT